MAEWKPCMCLDCDCQMYAEPDAERCYDCEHGIHDGDEGDTDGDRSDG